jgi:hypothetical protein
MGTTRDEVAAVIGCDVTPAARIFLPAGECLPGFRSAVAGVGADLVEVASGAASDLSATESNFEYFKENLDLVRATASSLGVADRHIRAGLELAACDIGALGIWRYRSTASETECIVVNAFAANDPESTLLVHDRVVELLDTGCEEWLGVMNLRHDRGDRTIQWAEVLAERELDRFRHLYLIGVHARAMRRQLRRSHPSKPITVLPRRPPAAMMRAVLSQARDKTVVFGFGNIGGAGETLVRHWSEHGDTLEV